MFPFFLQAKRETWTSTTTSWHCSCRDDVAWIQFLSCPGVAKGRICICSPRIFSFLCGMYRTRFWRSNAAPVGDARIRSHGLQGFGFCSREGTRHGKDDADREQWSMAMGRFCTGNNDMLKPWCYMLIISRLSVICSIISQLKK